MDCPNCGGETVAFPAEGELADRLTLPEDRSGGALCARCLAFAPVADPPADLPDFREISDAFPADPDDAALVAAVVALADSPAHYRAELDALVADAERAGVDLFLTLDRLADDPDLDPHLDLRRRSDQIEQLLR
ncbi:MAG: DUF6276 family protein [Halobacteriaceae archaeon]